MIVKGNLNSALYGQIPNNFEPYLTKLKEAINFAYTLTTNVFVGRMEDQYQGELIAWFEDANPDTKILTYPSVKKYKKTFAIWIELPIKADDFVLIETINNSLNIVHYKKGYKGEEKYIELKDEQGNPWVVKLLNYTKGQADAFYPFRDFSTPPTLTNLITNQHLSTAPIPMNTIPEGMYLGDLLTQEQKEMMGHSLAKLEKEQQLNPSQKISDKIKLVKQTLYGKSY